MNELIKGNKKVKFNNQNGSIWCLYVQCITEPDGFYREQVLADKTYRSEKKALEWAKKSWRYKIFFKKNKRRWK